MLSFTIVILGFVVDTCEDVIGQTPSDDDPEGPVDNLCVQNVSVDVQESVSLVGTDSSIPVSSDWESSGVSGES